MRHIPRVTLFVTITLLLLATVGFAQNPFGDPNPTFTTNPKPKAVQPAASEAQKHYSKGLQLLKESKVDAALAEFQTVKKLMPGQPAVYINLGLCYMQKQSFGNAEFAFREALKLDPKNAFARAQFTRVLMARDKNTEALASAKKLVAANRKDYDSQFLLGVVCLKMKDAPAAIMAFKSAVAIKPGDASALYNLGFCQINTKKYPDALKTFKEFLKRVPDDPQANLLAGVASEQTGDKTGAICCYEKAASKDSPAAQSAIMNMARLYSGMNKLDKAIEVLKKGAESNKDDYEINLSLGRLLASKNEHKEAQPYLLAAKKTRSDAMVNLALALNYLNLENQKDAEACARAALEQEPKDKQAIDIYAWVLQNERKQDEAVAAYRKWEQYYPDDPTPNEKIANIYRMQGKNEPAFTDFEKAMGKDPKNVDLMTGAASCLQDINKLDDAAKLLQKAIAADPKNERAYMTLAGVYDKQKKPELAIEQYKKILEFDAKSASAMRMLGAAYDAKGDYESEIGVLREFCDLNKTDIRTAMSIPRLYEKMGKLDEAITESKKLVDANAKDTQVRVQYGQLLASKKDYDGALAQYAVLTALPDVPSKSYGYFLTGGVQESQGKPDEALTSYKKCIDGTPANTPALDAISKIYESRKQQDEFYAYLKSLLQPGTDELPYGYYVGALKKADKTDEALKTMEELGAKYPDSAAISASLAEAYANAGVKDKAAEQYKKLLAKDKSFAWANRPLAVLYKSMGRDQDAAACYEQALAVMPYDFLTRKDLGDLYAKLGENAKAMEAYQEVLKMQPSNQEVKDKLQALQNGKPVPTVDEPTPGVQVQPAAPTNPQPGAEPAEQ